MKQQPVTDELFICMPLSIVTDGVCPYRGITVCTGPTVSSVKIKEKLGEEYSRHLVSTKSMLYPLFLVVLRHLNFTCRRFGTLCSIFIGGVSRKDEPVIRPGYTAYEDGTECSVTSAHEIQTPAINPKETIQHSEHDKSLK
jgi:hypothetical protein